MPALHHIPHYTVDDYKRWEGEWELWFGHAIAMSPSPGRPHGRFSARILAALHAQLDARDACGDCELVNEVDWILAEDLIVRPDISVLCGHEDDTFIREAPALIVEVLSPATHLRDRNEKREIYAERGVKHYLLADPPTLTLHDTRTQKQPEVHTIDLHDGCTIQLPRDWPKRR
ncbi:Uma2 family endonuclease [Phycisphaera mikurensis]|uniref:Putative restriction endonuclease domain-containing protein n=1 Tax=Phycisphaera mikurensis (strain NBRC 102666 / KCTC 22515 / FYK2301M01) TaxID=1142394 RepID=I0IDA0_PHYMF|nr:Uma2 family endonuclease [Phycisphaera mikurensis]MBB6442363.1 Uma2 family endonuclease [Phycisphaera mikurensis]BAM03238.1 hypothetical protein PSMK_10790 [Phycisphaera mikurensis NBRC 102666]